MLASLFSCFKGCDGHSKESVTPDGRRNPNHEKQSAKLLPGNPCISTISSDSGAAISSVRIEEGAECQPGPEWTPTDGSSSTSRPTSANKHDPKDRELPLVIEIGLGVALQGSSCCGQPVQTPPLPPISILSAGASRGADLQPGRPPTVPMLLSLRHLHMALVPSDWATQQHSPFTTDSPCTDLRPSSVDFAGLGLGDLTTSDSSGPMSVSGLHPQLRFVNACRLGEEVQDLQLVGRGAYGMVMTGNWRQEGRVAVKVLLSDEDKWMESCYKEAVLSKMLAHPSILQTYDFQVAVLTQADVARARASWEHHQMLQELQLGQCQDDQCCSSAGLTCRDSRADSFELLPTLSSDPQGLNRSGSAPASADLWQVLFMLGARPGQFVTLIIMEYAEVGTLQRAIAAGAFRESARLSKWAALRSLLVTAKEVAGGMCLLHSYKIIHGDLSATNVMLRASRIDKRGFVAKVADFGLSKVTLSGVVRTADWAGQAQYMAPECLDYESRLASDVFAFGVLLYEMAAGGRAFHEYAPAQILAGRLTGDLPLRWPADVAPELRALAERCMRRDPEARPSFREVVEDLRRQDAEAKAQHRQQSGRRRYTADGLSAAAVLAAAPAAAATAITAGTAGGSGCSAQTSGRQPSLLGPHRLAAAYHRHPGALLPTPTGQIPSVAAATATRLGAATVSVGGMSPPSWNQGPMGQRLSHGSAAAVGHTGPLRHSFTTGSAGLGHTVNRSDRPVAASAGGMTLATAVAVGDEAATASAATGEAMSEFTGGMLTIGGCLSAVSSGKLCCTTLHDNGSSKSTAKERQPLERISKEEGSSMAVAASLSAAAAGFVVGGGASPSQVY